MLRAMFRVAFGLTGVSFSSAGRTVVTLTVEATAPGDPRTDGGALVCKVFHGSGYSQLVELFKRSFRVVRPVKPKASRDRSAETFLVGIGLKKP